MAQILKKFTRADNISFDSSSTTFTSASDIQSALQEAFIALQNNTVADFRQVEIPADAGQTVFPVPDGYPVNFIQVFLDGVLLQDTEDYIATNGTDVVLNDAALVNQVLTVSIVQVLFQEFNELNADAKYLQLAGGIITGDLNVQGFLKSRSSVETVTSGRTLQESDCSNILYCKNTSDITITLPDASTLTNGYNLKIANSGQARVVINVSNNDFINIDKTTFEVFAGAEIHKVSDNEYLIIE